MKKVSNAETDDYVEINITWIIFWFNHRFCLDNFFLEAITITINIVPFYVYDCVYIYIYIIYIYKTKLYRNIIKIFFFL